MATTLSANALCTLVTLKEWLEETGTAKDDFLKGQINRATGLMEAHAKRKLKKRAYVNKQEEVNIDGAINGLIYLWQFPVQSIEQVVIDDVVIAAADYEFDTAGWVRLAFDPTPKENAKWMGSQIMRVDFTAGYDSTAYPEEFSNLELICLEFSAHLYYRSPVSAVGGSRLGLSARSTGDRNESFSEDAITPKWVKDELMNFVRTTWVPHRVLA